MSKWKEYKIGNMCSKVTDGAHNSPSEVAEGYPMFSVKDMEENGFNYSDVKLISRNDYDKLAKSDCKPLKNDVLIAKDGSYLKHVFVCEEEKEEVILSSIAILRPNQNIVEPHFLKYILKTSSVKTMMEGFVSGSALPRIVLKDFKKMVLQLPPIEEQPRIASILSAYDDLIENNNRRIALLEQMAEQIYKEWFVRMRFPGYENTEFEKGVPKGWKERKLSDLLKLSYGKSLLDEKRDGGEYPVYGSSGIVGFHSKSLAKGPGIIVGRKGNVGSLFYSYTDFFVIDTAYYVESEYSFIYLLHLLKTVHFIDGDAAVPGLNREQAYSNKIFFPGEDLVEKFDSLVSPIYQQRRNLQNQVQTLKQTRDLLLPRLISGKLMVKDVKKELGKTD